MATRSSSLSRSPSLKQDPSLAKGSSRSRESALALCLLEPRCSSRARRLPQAKLLLVASALAALAAIPRQAKAQTLELPRARQGYYLGGGLHAASTFTNDDGAKMGPWWGSEYTIRVGQMLTQRLGLGLAINFGGTAKDEMSSGFGGLGIEGQWELLDHLALHGGAGFGVVGLTDADNPDEPRRGSYGGAYSLTLSYDWFFSKDDLSGGWSLAPQATVRYYPDDPVTSTIFTLGLEVLYWDGLPSNELELPAGVGYEKDD